MGELPGHRFWSDDLSPLHTAAIDATRLPHASQITDSYLLALAFARGGKLATFDRRIVTDAVLEGARALHLIA